jgi:hypothetical protein
MRISTLAKQLSFEILLNPSVPDAEQLRLSRQGHRMYRLFAASHKMGTKVSTESLMEIACQYSARLNELRHALIPLGWCIDMVRKGSGGNNYFKLVRLGESSYYKNRHERGLL